jgi:signal transduction histidine kinase
MWTAREIARALRGEKAAILSSWQAEAQERFWHIDKILLTRKGEATRCASSTLTALVNYHQARELHSATSEQAVAVREADSKAALDQLIAPCADDWAALPVPWPDTRSLMDCLAAQTAQVLAARGADPDSLALGNGVYAHIAVTAADRHVMRLEQQLASHREEFATTQHLAGRFMANTSHELRTPLTAVLGFAELLLEETYGALNAEQRTAVGHIENSAQNLLEVVNNLLDLLRIRAGKLTLQQRPLVVLALLRHIYDILMPLANRKGVSFQMELPSDLGMIEADENILRHVIYYLLSSALRATPAGGQVTLHATRTDGTLTIFTHDTALHLPPEAVANMADPFPLLENSPARGYEGWEVGLPLVRRYVELHEGRLELESDAEQGTTFRILLPTTRGGIRNHISKESA